MDQVSTLGGRERRSRRSDDERIQFLAATCSRGACDAEVRQHHAISTSLTFSSCVLDELLNEPLFLSLAHVRAENRDLHR